MIAFMRSTVADPGLSVPPNPGRLLREVRGRHGVSQRQLAIRAGTTQSAISRIESGSVSPTVATLARLLALLGDDLALSAESRDVGIDTGLVRSNRRLTQAERFSRGVAHARLVHRNRGIANVD